MWFYKILQLQKMFLQKNLKHFGCVWDLKPQKKTLLQKEKKNTKKCLLDEKERKTTKKCLLDARKRNVFGAV